MSKVIFKLSFTHPNMKSSASKNKGMIKYIATRQGVDKSVGADGGTKTLVAMTVGDSGTERNVLVDDLGDFDYSSEKALDKELKLDFGSQDYAQYIDERPNSHGLFGQDGVENLLDFQDDVGEAKSFVWTAIISLKEEDALGLGFAEKNAWQDLLRNKMPIIADTMGIDRSYLKWGGAVHMEQGHPHVHVMFWEEKPKLKHGVIPSKKLDEIRKILTDDVFRERRELLLGEKNMLREMLLKGGETDLSKIISETDVNVPWIDTDELSVNEVGLSTKMTLADEETLRKMIGDLSENLPSQGRKAYGYMPPDVKREIDEVVDHIFGLPEFEAIIAKNERIVGEMTSLYTGKEDDIKKAVDNSTKDLKKRFGQLVLKSAFAYRDSYVLTANLDWVSKAMKHFETNVISISESLDHKAVSEKCYVECRAMGIDSESALSMIKAKGLMIDEESLEELETLANEKIFSLNTKREIANSVGMLKWLGFSEDDTYNILYKNNYLESNKVQAYANVDYFKPSGILSQTGYSVMSDNAVVTKDMQMISAEAFKRSIEGEPLTVEALYLDEEFAESLPFRPKVFEYTTMDKRVADVFSTKGLEHDGKLVIDDKIIREHILDKLADDYSVEEVDDEQEELMIDLDNSYNSLVARLNTLKLNRVIEQDRETGQYIIEPEKLQEIISDKRPFKFGKYDATITLEYFEDGVLEESNLKNMFSTDGLEQSLVGKTPFKYLELKEGKPVPTKLGYEILKVNKLLKDSPNIEYDTMDDVLKKLVKIDHQGKVVLKLTSKTGLNNILLSNKFEDVESMESLLDLIDRKAKEVVLEKKVKSVLWRLDSLTKIGILGKDVTTNTYKVTELGNEKKLDILNPNREQIRERLEYFEALGYIEIKDGNIVQTDVLKNAVKDEEKIQLEGFEKIKSTCHNNNGFVDRDVLKSRKDYQVTKSYYDKDYDNDLDIFKSLGLKSKTERAVKTVSTLLLLDGKSIDDIKLSMKLLLKNDGKELFVDDEMIDKAIESSAENYADSRKWGNDPYVSKKDYEEAMEVFEIENAPEYDYQKFDDYSKGFNASGLFKILEQEAKKEANANEMMTNIMDRKIKANAKKQNKSARKQEAKKQNKGFTFDD